MQVDPSQLSLHIARFLHAPADARRSPVRWRLLPDLTERTFVDACSTLQSLPKPLIFAPLTEPGSIYVTPVAMLDDDTARRWQWHHRNQITNFTPFMTRLRAADDDTIAFGREDDVVETRISVLRRWTEEYLVPLQVTITADPARASYHWLVIRHGDGCWSHGWSCRVP
jgi:hypothetical protein